MNTIKKHGNRVTIEIDDLDCEIVVSALKVATATRNVGRKMVNNVVNHEGVSRVIGPFAAQITKANDNDARREAALIKLFSKGIE